MTLVLLAAGTGSEVDKAAPLGLFVILALVVVVFFLARSMVKHVRKVPKSFDGLDDRGNELHRLGEAVTPDVMTDDPSEVTPRLLQTPPRLGTPDQYYGPNGKRPQKNQGSKTQQKARLRARKQQLKARKSAGQPSPNPSRSARRSG